VTVLQFPVLGTPPGPKTGLRSFLKQETAARHQQIDDSFDQFKLDTQEGYSGFLTAHCIAWSALADDWSKAVAHLLGTAAPDYAQMLVQDLAELGPPAAACLPEVAVECPACDAGMAYVLAGSRMGFGAISRKPHWGTSNMHESRFMKDGQGADLFRAVIAYLDGPQGQALDQSLALQSAHQCFDVFGAAVKIAKRAAH
jgi:heme oxygenase